MSKFSACGRQVLPAVGTCQWHERFYFIKETFKSLTTFWSLLNVSKTPPSPVKPRGSGWTVSTHERRSHDRFGSNRVSTRCKKSDGTVVKPPESVGKPPSTPLPPCGINSRGAMLSRADSSLHCVSFGMTIDTIIISAARRWHYLVSCAGGGEGITHPSCKNLIIQYASRSATKSRARTINR